MNLDAKNSIKDGSASFVGFGSVLAGYFGIPYTDSIGRLIIAGYVFFMAYVALRESTLVLLDAVNNPNLSTQIAEHIQKKFQLTAGDILIRPLGTAIEAHISIILEPDMTLKDILKITDDIKKSTADEFKINQVVVIPTSKH